MKKYRIVESDTEGYYWVQEWRPRTWYCKEYWMTQVRYKHAFHQTRLSLEEANEFMDHLLKQEVYLNQPRKVIREEEVG